MKVIGSSILAALLLISPVLGGERPIDQGTMVISGSAYLNAQGGDMYTDSWDVNINPTIGTFVSDGILLAGNFYIRHLKYNEGYYDGQSATVWGFGPAIGFYFAPAGSKGETSGAVYPYIMLSTNYCHSDQINILGSSLNIGMLLMLSRSVALDIGGRVDYDRASLDNPLWGDYIAHNYAGSLGVGVAAFVF